MGRIKLVTTFELIPEGTHVFKIEEVKHDEDFGKVEVYMVTDKGQKHTERFKLMNQLGVNDGAMKAFSYFAKTALNDFSVEDIDVQDLVGKFIEMDIFHNKQESNKNPGEYVTFVNSKDKRPASGFPSDDSIDDLLA